MGPAAASCHCFGPLAASSRTGPRFGLSAPEPRDYLRSELGEQAWAAGMNPDLPPSGEVLDNPYQYTEFKSESTHGARGSLFGEDD